ncbi:hypothetical protein [Nostoc sp. NZL]|nr:hypothetical protein [Nostoc sp. NZL]
MQIELKSDRPLQERSLFYVKLSQPCIIYGFSVTHHQQFRVRAIAFQ